MKKVIRSEEAETYEPEKDWRRVSLRIQSGISTEHVTKRPAMPRNSTLIRSQEKALRVRS